MSSVPPIFKPTTRFSVHRTAQLDKHLASEQAVIEKPLQEHLSHHTHRRIPFVLHDGPPYANGPLHVGHSVNKVLKDVVNRSAAMQGFDVEFTPGWDCHGLPIEWSIEEHFRKQGKLKNDISATEFRKACRDFAQKWIDIQADSFQELGVRGNWKSYYTTFSHKAESQIAHDFLELFIEGYIYQGVKPVLWSIAEETALAEAEVEYRERQSTSLWVGFPITTPGKYEGAAILVWTTTPWTLPASRAVAYHPNDRFVMLIGPRYRLIVSISRLAHVKEVLGEPLQEIDVATSDIAQMTCHHPLKPFGYDQKIPLLPGAHVAHDVGTGFVHTAPSHGPEDFALAQTYGLPIENWVGPTGYYDTTVPLVGGKFIFSAEADILDSLEKSGLFVKHETLRHSYPHSWRSKKPLIYRATPQWFLRLDSPYGPEPSLTLRQKVSQVLDTVSWWPEKGKNRLLSMLENRPDWCLSRQRLWGVPLPLFVHKATGKPLKDAQLNTTIVAAFATHGCDFWFSGQAESLLKEAGYDPREYTQVNDILDVWFESGLTHRFVLDNTPCDVYLEGSDQHRGWFMSSLVMSVALSGKAPMKHILTHGFVVDEQGKKMSKSSGNGLAPQDIIDKYGLDVLRVWIVSSEFREDLRLGHTSLIAAEKIVKRLRNTLRYLLGGLNGFTSAETVTHDQLPCMEKWILAKLFSMHHQFSWHTFDFSKIINTLHTFCTSDLSAFYFDVRKDSLYCDSLTSLQRRSVRTVFKVLFECLVRWSAPIMVCGAQEAWQAFRQEVSHDEALASYIQDTIFVKPPDTWQDEALCRHMDHMRNIRRVVTGALEEQRQAKHIGSSLEAHALIHTEESLDELLVNLLDVSCLTSHLTIKSDSPGPETAFRLDDVPGIAVEITKAPDHKCQRCWKFFTPTSSQSSHKSCLCQRCGTIDAQ